MNAVAEAQEYNYQSKKKVLEDYEKRAKDKDMKESNRKYKTNIQQKSTCFSQEPLDPEKPHKRLIPFKGQSEGMKDILSPSFTEKEKPAKKLVESKAREDNYRKIIMNQEGENKLFGIEKKHKNVSQQFSEIGDLINNCVNTVPKGYKDATQKVGQVKDEELTKVRKDGFENLVKYGKKNRSEKREKNLMANEEFRISGYQKRVVDDKKPEEIKE